MQREGYARATTNRIAERAGISVGSLYQYFDDKDAIFDALLKDYFGRLVGAVREDPIDPSRPLEETFRRLASLGLRAWPKGLEVLHQLQQVGNGAVRTRARRAKGELLAVLRTVAQAHRAKLRLRGADLDEALALVIGAAEGMFYDLPRELDADHAAQEIATMFARYLTKTHSPTIRVSSLSSTVESPQDRGVRRSADPRRARSATRRAPSPLGSRGEEGR